MSALATPQNFDFTASNLPATAFTYSLMVGSFDKEIAVVLPSGEVRINWDAVLRILDKPADQYLTPLAQMLWAARNRTDKAMGAKP